ncbi:50S ribosomal protein L32 [bacterium]|jgi:large subunit ribosomal protein L32|nr:50S ribosomal protein L32 [bacterium]
MPVPKRRTSVSKKNKRRSHHALSAPAQISCPQCGEPRLRHRACASCGTYRGRKVAEARGD